MIDAKVKETSWLLAGGLVQLVYGLGEIGDTLYLLFLQAHWLPNVYPAWTLPEVEGLMHASRLSSSRSSLFFRLGGWWLPWVSCTTACGASG